MASNGVRLSVGVQHHPKRFGLLPDLLDALSGLQVDIVHDPAPNGRPSAWRTFRKALETTPEWATHRLVIQDDGIPCQHFPQVVGKAVEARPGNLLTLCVCGNAAVGTIRIYQAANRGENWLLYPRSSFIPVVATVWPVEIIEPALAYVDAQPWSAGFTADDEITLRIAEHLDIDVYATIPSLVVHDDRQESLIVHRQHTEDPGRVTSCPPPVGCDLREQTW
jgi:hypothetical protein